MKSERWAGSGIMYGLEGCSIKSGFHSKCNGKTKEDFE